MREYNFSAGRSSARTTSSRSSHASNPLLQRKRTLDEFPMEHSREDTHRLFQQRRISLAKQRENLVSTTGESKQLRSYSRKRFETALTIKGKESLPPPSPEERSLFWEDVKPTWSYRRYLSMSATPVSKPIELSPRPGSGPPGGAVAKGRPVFNHLRGNNVAYPTIRKLLQESNTEYRVVCPSTDGYYSYRENFRRPSMDYSTKSDCLLVPLDDPTLSPDELEGGKKVEEKVDKDEDQLHAEMILMSKLEDVESVVDERKLGHENGLPGVEKILASPNLPKSEFRKSKLKRLSDDRTIVSSGLSQAEDEKREDEEDEDSPASPWHCWVDDATVSSVHSKKSVTEILTTEATPSRSTAPEVVVEQMPAPVQEPQDKESLSLVPGKAVGKNSSLLMDKKRNSSSTNERRKSGGAGKRKGGKRAAPEQAVEEIVELPPPPPPPPIVEEVLEDVNEVEEPPEPVLPSYICPSSVIKSNQTEIKLWLQKSTFSAARRLLPMY